MNVCVLRRNRRTNPAHPIGAKKELVLFFVSLVVFFGGMTSLAWAVHAHPQAPDNQTAASSETSAQNNASSETYSGDIKTQHSAGSSSTASASASSSASRPSSSTSTPTSASSVARQGENVPSAHSADTHNTQEHVQQESSAASAPEHATDAVAETSTQDMSYHIVHHTAYQATPIYRTVHHQASIAREVSIGGSTTIEWTVCPVCGGRHDSAYNERVLDHTNESFCSACGGSHEYAYDELIYD